MLTGLELPLILAATEPLESIYRSLNSYPHLVLAGCGSSGDTAKSTSSAAASTTSPTSTPESSIEGDAVERMPKVPEATEPTRLSGSMDATEESAFLTAVFHDAEAMWMREFAAAGIDYAPARLTIFRDEVHTACGTQNARLVPAAPALAHDGIRAGRARRMRHLRLVNRAF